MLFRSTDCLIINFSSAHQFRCDFNFSARTDSFGPIVRLTISECNYRRRDTQSGPQYVREYIFAIVQLQEDPPRQDSREEQQQHLGSRSNELRGTHPEEEDNEGDTKGDEASSSPMSYMR